jgi:hypothetical protein
MGREQATVIELDHFLVSKMNVAIECGRIQDRLGADQSSPRRDGKLIGLRPSARNKEQNWHD